MEIGRESCLEAFTEAVMEGKWGYYIRQYVPKGDACAELSNKRSAGSCAGTGAVSLRVLAIQTVTELGWP